MMFDKKEMKLINFEKAKKYLMEGVQVYMVNLDCIFRKNCASVPEEGSAIPLQTEQSSAG